MLTKIVLIVAVVFFGMATWIALGSEEVKNKQASALTLTAIIGVEFFAIILVTLQEFHLIYLGA